MIDFETAQIKRIKRANTDWWINEKSMVGKNGMTYVAYYNDIGEIHVKEIDAKCSRHQAAMSASAASIAPTALTRVAGTATW
ncbi:MAG: hypothetical protein IJX80_10180 [Clostridia bacterium]|nr:hypothetical protein [Clostridia bacterium]